MIDIFSDLKPAQNKEPESIWDTTNKIKNITFENYGSSVDQDINMSIPTYEKPEYGRSMLTNNYSLADLEKDPEFAKRAARFLEGIGRNENIFEYLRDADYSLSAAIVRSTEVDDWTNEQQQDYVYLRDKFGRANLKGFKERFNMVKDIGIDVLGDPLNILAALFAIPTGGVSLGVRGALGAAAQAGARKFTAAQLAKGAVAKTGGKKLTARQLRKRADLQKRLIRRDLPKAAKAGALFGAAEGMAWGGLHEYFMQDIDIDLDMRDGYDLASIAGTTALGGFLGAGIGAGVSSLVTRNSKTYLTKQYKHSNENLIDDVAGSQSRLEIFKDSIIDSGLYKKGKLGLSKAISKTFGKPTTWFQEYVDKSPELKTFMKKLRYDWDSTLTSRGEKGVKEKSFGLFLGETVGKFNYGLAKSLNVLYRVGWRARLDPIQNKELVEMLRNNTLTLKNIDKKAKGGKYTPEVVTAYKGVRETLDAAFDEANLAGLFGEGVRLAAGYFPRLFKYDVLEEKQGIFKKHLIDSGHADPINFMPAVQIIEDTTDEIKKGILRDAKNIDEVIFGIDFLKEAGVKKSVIGSGRNQKDIYSLDDATPQQILKAKELKADKIVNDMLEYRWTPFELRSSNQGKGSGYLQERRFRNIKDNDIAEFLEDDVQQILETYFTNTGQAIARSKYFGRTILEFEKNTIQPMKAELNASKMDKTEIEEVIERVRLTHRRVTGIETDARSPLKRKKWARTAADFGKLSQQMAHLPFATLSSITEPLLLLTRAGARDAPKVGRDIVSAIAQEGKNTIDRSWRGIQRGLFKKKVTGAKDIGTPSQKKGASIFDDMDDTTWGELYKTGLALEQAVQERIAGLAGEGMHNSVMKNIQAGFFKANLLSQWTKAVQLASFTTGKRLIKQRAKALYEHKTGKKLIRLTGDSWTSTTKYYIRQLNDLGVDENDAMEWYKKSLNSKGEFDAGLAKNVMLKSRQTGKDVNFYYGDYASGANRFTKEIILNPSTAEANRPLWFSNPSAQMLVQFAGYPTVFNNTILKRFTNELVESPAQSIPKVVPTVILMSAVAHMGNYIRSQGENMKDYETGLQKADGEIVGEAIRRWGGFGPVDYVKRYDDEAERNLPSAIAAMKAFGGPLPQDVIDMVLFRKGLLELGVTNLPFYGALPASTRKDWRSAARGSTPKDPTTGYRGSLAKGGLVYNVPNVHPEPDEVKMRGSDQTYNDVAGVVLKDEEDRIFKNKGGTVYNKLQERKQLALGGFASTIVKQLVKEAVKLSNKKGSNPVESSNLYERIQEFSLTEYDNWFKSLPKNKQKEIENLELNYKPKFNYTALTPEAAETNRLQSSKLIGTGLTDGGKYGDVFPHVLEFYKANPEIKKLDETSRLVVAPLHEEFHIRIPDYDLYMEGLPSKFDDVPTPPEAIVLDGKITRKLEEEIPWSIHDEPVYKIDNINYDLLIKKLKDSDFKVGDSENLINKYLNELTDKYSFDNLADFGEPVRFSAFEDEVENLGLTTLYNNIPKAQQSKLEKLLNKHKKLEIKNQELYKQLYSIQDDS